ncbi:hypothetical protein C8J57DRAFT_1220941 [Mycena rebaudengoi]|nr:hypothetical protein C8J57DRAFT_1220941 [Mycena rebaudengoi]
MSPVLISSLLFKQTSISTDTSPTHDVNKIIDVDKLEETAKQCFFTDEGKVWLPIDVDAGEQDNPINVEMWIALDKATSGKLTNGAGAQDNPINVEKWIALSEATSAGVVLGNLANVQTSGNIFNCCICFGTFVKPVT